MDFALSAEQRALADSVRSYLADRFPLTRVRELYDAPTHTPPADLWAGIAEQGWLAVLVPEEHDGAGGTVLDAAVIARELGAGLAAAPWTGTVLLGEAVRLAGSVEQRALLPRVASGDLFGAFAAHPLVEWGAAAELVVSDDALATVASAQEHATLDATGPLATVTLGSPDPLPGASPDVRRRLLDLAAVLTANDLVGMARRALTMTVDYDTTRVQFGRPVGSFQALKHALADLHLGVTLAEHAALHAAHALDTDAPDAAVAASIAKVKASETGRAVMTALIQFHGGIGYTWEHDAHFFLKRSKRLESTHGSAAEHRERIARLIVDA